MSTPTGDNAFLYELEIDVRAEITSVEAGRPAAEALPVEEWLTDPADAQRDEVVLLNLLGAVEALEDKAHRSTS